MRRISTIAAALGLLAAACGGGGGTSSSSAADLELTTQTPDTAVEADLDIEVIDRKVAGVDEELELFLQELQVTIDELGAECAASDAQPRQNADLSNRVFTGPDLRCVDLSGANLRNATLDGVDLSGASLAGADLTGAKLDVVAVGADFTNAIIDHADFQDSVLHGARFAGSTITGTTMPDNPTALAMADFTGSTMGCGSLFGAPMVILADVQITDTCQADAYGSLEIDGVFYGADVRGFDFSVVSLRSADFRRSNLAGAYFGGYGILPDGADFSGAVMVGVSFTSTAIYDASFVGADLSSADLTNMLLTGSDLSGAVFDGADMSNAVSERNSYVGASFVQTIMANTSLAYDDFSNALFDGVMAEGLVLDTILCPGATSNDSFGLCVSDSAMVF